MRTDKEKEYRKKYEAERREQRRATDRSWRMANPDKIKAYKKTEYIRHREAIRARAKADYQKNREIRIEYRRIRYNENRETICARQNEIRKMNPEMHSARSREYRKKNRAAHAVSSTKKSARIKGVAFNLTKEWFQERFDNGHCEMSGLPFDMNDYKRGDNTPSVDRIIPGGPYTQDNCRLILWSLNHALGKRGQDYVFNMFRRAIAKHDAKNHVELPAYLLPDQDLDRAWIH